MPSIPILKPKKRGDATIDNPLPNILQTPSGLALLEIQGTVNSTQEPQAGSPLEIGELQFPLYDSNNPASDTAWQKRVHLYVGKHQRLTGEIKKLQQPVALLCRAPADGVRPDGDEALEVAEIVYYKLLFGHRPEPVGTKDEH